MPLNKRVAMVTGAGRGIGLAIARELGLAGALVVLTDVVPYVEDAARDLASQGLKTSALPLDVSRLTEVEAAIRTISDRYGSLDILVNNAGIRPTRRVLEMSAVEWEKVLAVNLTGTFYCCQAAAPHMIERGWGRIVNLSSMAAQQGSTGGHSHYAAAKAGIVGFSRSLARELAPSGITVNVVSPGWIDTEGWEGQLDGHRDEYAARVPVGRLGSPEDVAHAVAFLASEEASYITGVVLPINGGLYIS